MNYKLLSTLLLTSALAFTNPALAAENKKEMKATKDHPGEMAKDHHGDGQHKGGHGKKGHNFSPGWAKTLSDEQRVAVDKMHLKLDGQHAVLKAQAGLLQKELNVMTAKDGADQKAIHTKIDDLMAIKSEIMKYRYDHLSEMRAVLNEQQRISYDMAILKREGAK